MTKVQLRPTLNADLPFVLRTESDRENTLYISQWSEERHREVMGDPDWAHEIIEDERGEPVGYLIAKGLHPQGPRGAVYLQRIAMYQRDGGYGRAALTAFIERVFAMGARRLWLRVYETNARGRHLYSSLGMVEEERVPATRAGDPARIVMAITRP